MTLCASAAEVSADPGLQVECGLVAASNLGWLPESVALPHVVRPRAWRTPSDPLNPRRVAGMVIAIVLHSLAFLMVSLEQRDQRPARAPTVQAEASARSAIEVSFIARAEPLTPPAPPALPPAPVRAKVSERPRQPSPDQPSQLVPEPSARADRGEPAREEMTPHAPMEPVAEREAPVPDAGASNPSLAPSTSMPTHAPAMAADPARMAREQQAYVRELLAWLRRHRVYPDTAKKAKAEGSVLVRFILDREGRLLAAEIAGSSGSAVLDAAALEVLQRAGKAPPLPPSMGRERLSISLPIEYSLSTP